MRCALLAARRLLAVSTAVGSICIDYRCTYARPDLAGGELGIVHTAQQSKENPSCELISRQFLERYRV